MVMMATSRYAESDADEKHRYACENDATLLLLLSSHREDIVKAPISQRWEYTLPLMYDSDRWRVPSCIRQTDICTSDSRSVPRTKCVYSALLSSCLIEDTAVELGFPATIQGSNRPAAWSGRKSFRSRRLHDSLSLNIRAQMSLL